MAEKKSYTWPITTILVALALGLVAAPQQYKAWAPEFIRNLDLHYGLDLAGGTQLDFRISEAELDEQIAAVDAEIEEMQSRGLGGDDLYILQAQQSALENQKQNLVEAIRTVLERRINALGVSEATITPSYFGNEKHLLVECPGVVDVQQCIQTVGKTIKLEFKEELTEATEEFEADIRAKAARAYARITQSGETLQVLGQDLSGQLGVIYRDSQGIYRDELPDALSPLWNAEPGSAVRMDETALALPYQSSDGRIEYREVPGLLLAEVVGPRTQTGRTLFDASEALNHLANTEEGYRIQSHTNALIDDRTPAHIHQALQSLNESNMAVAVAEDNSASVLYVQEFTPGAKTVEASHILVSYQGAVQADAAITRSKEEAEAEANALLERLKNGESFETLAKEHSDGPSGAKGGSLGEFGRGVMTPAFEAVAFSLEQGKMSPPVETQFGYHIVRSDRAPSGDPDKATYLQLHIPAAEEAKEAELTAHTTIELITQGLVTRTEEQAHIRSLFFSLLPSGWKDTALDGKHFQAATVTLDPNTNQPVVQISFDDKGGELFGELTSRNIGKRIAIFVGGEIVTAPTVQSSITDGVAIITNIGRIDEASQLALDLNTGAIPAPIFLSGQRTVEATLGAEALRTSMEAALIGVLILMAYMLIMYRGLGLIADIALSIYAFIFFAFLKMPLFLFSGQHIVLTLAGMAGIILSVGMAVDANVLIFERMKEELRKGKLLKTAAHTGFERAWPSIRDGNVSTFITCSILFLIGTSIVRGFAITLGMGVLISMFTAIVITRWMLRHVANSPLAESGLLFRKKHPQSTEPSSE